jgi:hypothetical protein
VLLAPFKELKIKQKHRLEMQATSCHADTMTSEETTDTIAMMMTMMTMMMMREITVEVTDETTEEIMMMTK